MRRLVKKPRGIPCACASYYYPLDKLGADRVSVDKRTKVPSVRISVPRVRAAPALLTAHPVLVNRHSDRPPSLADARPLVWLSKPVTHTGGVPIK